MSACVDLKDAIAINYIAAGKEAPLPSDADFTMIKEVAQLLQPIAEATFYLEKQTGVTISCVVPTVRTCVTKIKSLRFSGTVSALEETRTLVLAEFQERFNPIPQIYFTAMLLDPRFRLMKGCTAEEVESAWTDLAR